MAERGGANKVTRTDEDKVKFDAGGCDELQKESMKCVEDLGYDRTAAQTVCKPQFDAYRACRQKILDAKKARRQHQHTSDFFRCGSCELRPAAHCLTLLLLLLTGYRTGCTRMWCAQATNAAWAEQYKFWKK